MQREGRATRHGARMERYPLRLVKAIVDGLVEYFEHGGQLDAMGAGPHVDEPGLQVERLPAWGETKEKQYYDDLTGFPLDFDKVCDARRLEMNFMHKLHVWTIRPVSECWETQPVCLV